MLYRLLLLIVISLGIMPLLVSAQTTNANNSPAQRPAKLQLGNFVEIVEINGTKEFGLVTKLDEKSVDLQTATAYQNIPYNQISSVNELKKEKPGYKKFLSKIGKIALIPVEVVVYTPFVVLFLIAYSV